MSKIIQISWVSHNAAFTSAFTNLRVQNTFCDVTVCSRGNYFPAHRLILSAFSDYFKEILEQTPCKHPFILVQDANGEDLKALLDFIYGGEISVESERMESFLKLAQNLEVRGFISPIKNEEYGTSCPAPPSEFCVNMTELGKRVQTPGVAESYEVPESTKRNWGPKSKRKRGKEPPPCEESVEDSSPLIKMVKETLTPEKRIKESAPPTKKVRETSPLRKIVKEISPLKKMGKVLLPPKTTIKPKQGKNIRESTPPAKMIQPKQEPLDNFQMTTETDRAKTSKNFVGKPMVIIENCAAAVELSRTPKDEKVSVMIPPMENCLTLLDSDDDFFDDDFPSDPSSTFMELESSPIEKSAPKDERKVKSDDVQGTNKEPRSISNSETSRPKRTQKYTQKLKDLKENPTFSPGTDHYTQEHFQFAVKDEGELDCKNGITSAATSNLSTVEKREALKVTFKVKDKGEMLYDIVSPKSESDPNETAKSSSISETSTKVDTSKEGDEEEEKKKTKKKKGKKELFQCQYCSYKTPIAVNLRVHLRIHTGEKPFVCSLCPYKSTQGSALRTHMQTHLQNKRVKCPHCDFKTRFGLEELKEHLKIHTDTTTYQCQECTFITNRYQSLQRHEFKNHIKSTNICCEEDSAQPKKAVKKSNPYKSRKRSLLSKKLMAKRKKEKSSVAKKSTASQVNVNTPSTSSNTNENLTPALEMEEEMDQLFDSPKTRLPTFKGFADTKVSPVRHDACESPPNSSNSVTASSLVTQSCTAIIPSVSFCTTATTPKIQSSTYNIPNISSCVTTNTSTTLTTIYSKVLANTSTTLCLVKAVSQPPVVEISSLSTVPSVRAIQLISLPNTICHSPVISSNPIQGTSEEPFLLPKVTNVCGRVPFSSPSILSTSYAEDTTDPLENLESIPSPEDSLSNTNVDLNDPLSFSPQTHSEDCVQNAITITSVSSGVEFNEALPVPCVDTPSTKDQFDTSNNTEGSTCEARAIISSTEDRLNNTLNKIAKGLPCVPCPDPSTEDDFNMSDEIIEVPPCDVPCSDALSTEDNFNNTSEDVDGPQIRITSISTCSDEDAF